MTDAAPVTEDSCKDALVGVHRLQRRLVLTAFDGLTDEQWVTAVLPSGWTPAALLAHLALDVERWWFALVQDGGLDVHALPADGWHQAHGMTPGQVRAMYARCCAEADEVTARTSLDAVPRAWPVELFGDFRLPDLRAVLLHVITETAAHLGHADVVRELIDGHQRLVLT